VAASKEKLNGAGRTAAGEALTKLILMIFRANVELLDAGPLIARDPTMISMRWQMLTALKSGDKTAAQLGREIGITRQGALLNVQSLESSGYVVLVDDAEDQRAKKVSLTQAGADKLKDIHRYQSAWINQLGTHFEPAQIYAALEVLDKLRQLTPTSVRVLESEHRKPSARAPSSR
jgi:DNA-binding MarR family transcriptional regulator